MVAMTQPTHIIQIWVKDTETKTHYKRAMSLELLNTIQLELTTLNHTKCRAYNTSKPARPSKANRHQSTQYDKALSGLTTARDINLTGTLYINPYIPV